MSDVLRERIARALWDREAEDPMRFQRRPWDEVPERHRVVMRTYADAVIAALPLIEQRPSDLNMLAVEMQRNMPDDRRRYVTPWERIEEDG